MTARAIQQPAESYRLRSQKGGQFVLEQAVELEGGDVLVGFSGSAWSSAKNQVISLQLWFDGRPVAPGLLQMLSTADSAHVSLGHTWALVRGVSPGKHTLAVMAGHDTVTDENDTAFMTIWQLGPNLAVHHNRSAPCPSGQGQTLVRTGFATQGGTPVMVSVSTSGWAADGERVIGATVTLDGDTGGAGRLETYMNNANQHLAAVPADLVFTPPNRGQHGLTVASEAGTWTDGGDTVHVNVVEWLVAEGGGPAIVPTNPPLRNAPAATQRGLGNSIASATFTSSGGTLLISTHLSAWSSAPNVTIAAGIQIDGQTKGYVRLFTNWQGIHQPLVSNDLVVTGIPAGQHTLELIGKSTTCTDFNDRVSVTILEFQA